ncbi:hypothetical protein DFH09DRAFT_1320110 [Mycena vulgaris]|nr:hypothetical protein DFH09DRAFT_1320110 [Mycena vulgaris]
MPPTRASVLVSASQLPFPLSRPCGVLPNPPFTFGEASSLALLQPDSATLQPRCAHPPLSVPWSLPFVPFFSYSPLLCPLPLPIRRRVRARPCARDLAAPMRARVPASASPSCTRSYTRSYTQSRVPAVSVSISGLVVVFVSVSVSVFVLPHPQLMHPFILPSQISTPTLSLRAIPDALA